MNNLDKQRGAGQDSGVVILSTVILDRQTDFVEDYFQAQLKHRGLFDQAQAARAIGVSRARINKLVMSGRLPLVNIMTGGEGSRAHVDTLIPGNALVAWLARPKSKGGRGRKADPLAVELAPA